jgi:hypothetical protein
MKPPADHRPRLTGQGWCSAVAFLIRHGL